MTLDVNLIASNWLSALGSALRSGDGSVVAALFLPDGWLRDVLVFSWDLHTIEGRDNIVTHVANSLKEDYITNVRLDDTPELEPRVRKVPLSQDMFSVEFGFRFELPHGHGRGLARLVQDQEGTFRAFAVVLTLHDLHGFEDSGSGLSSRKDDVTIVKNKHVEREDADWASQAEKDPYVLIVGGGHSGLEAAARFKRLNMRCLVIEKNARIGDNWRMRHPCLTLESCRRHHTLLYQPFPADWPEYTPRDELADWLEGYVCTQSLVVWTDSEFRVHPRYDDRAGRWDVRVVRAGVETRLRPSHIVIATGMLSHPLIPAFADLEQFQGRLMHSSEFRGGSPFTGKQVVVIGAGDSSIDICADLAHSAQSVTMVQRSTTCVITRDNFNVIIKEMFPEDEPLDVSDLRLVALPFLLLEKLSVASRQATMDAHKEVFDNLRKGGFSIADAGGNPYVMHFRRQGAFWLDKGGAALVGDGRIKVESGKSVERFTKTGLILSDGTELPADLVVFATGYTPMREPNTELLGPDVMKHVGPVGGMDGEGELNGLFRPCGHPGLWFAAGDFFYSRFFSKPLALQIEAIKLGILHQNSKLKDRMLDYHASTTSSRDLHLE